MVKKLVIVATAISILLLGLGCPPPTFHLRIIVEGEGTTDPSEDTYSYDNDSIVPMTATPAAGWRFDHWQGDISGTDNSTTLTMDSDKIVIAQFTIIQYTLSIDTVGEGTTDPSEGTYSYNKDSPITLTATPAAGWRFVEWQGDTSGTNKSTTLTMNSDKDITAFFNEVEVDVRITRIFYNGLVFGTEADEYVEIKNYGIDPVNLEGWLLKDISEGYPEFIFPYYMLQPQEIIRVYTDQIHPEWGSFSFEYGKAIWHNEEPDTAALYCLGEEVSRKSY